MDPLSITAGVAGLVTLTVQVTKSVTSFGRAMIHERQDVQALLKEIETTRSVLQELYPFLSDPKVNSITFQQTSALEVALRICNETIKSLQQRLDNLNSNKVSRSFERLRWPLSDKELQKVLQTLGRCTSTFQFALTVEGW